MSPSRRPFRHLLTTLAAAAVLLAAFPAAAGASVLPSASSPAVQVSGGEWVTCAVRQDGTVWCWGTNNYQMLGLPAETPRSAVPVQIPGITTATQVEVGYTQSCALLADTTVVCWGDVAHGDGTYSITPDPVAVPGLTGVTKIALGSSHACALMGDNTVECWGPLNTNGELGPNGGLGTATPVTVDGVDEATDVSADEGQACAVAAGLVKCWGASGHWELGDGVGDSSATPVTVARIGQGAPLTTPQGGTETQLPAAVAVVAGRQHTCALLVDGTAACWGGNQMGYLGDGTTIARPTPKPVVEVSGITQLAAGGQGGCALLGNHTIRCWGYGSTGQIGDGKPYTRTVAEPVSGITTAIQVNQGWGQVCAVLADGSIRCWGSGYFGEVGDNTYYGDGATTTGAHLVPVQVWGFPPASGAPVATLRAGAALTGTAVPVSVAWTTGDGSGLGVATYDHRVSTDGGSTWSDATSSPASPFTTTAATTGTLTFEVNAVDYGAHEGSWGLSNPTTVRLVQQTLATYAGTWSLTSASKYSGGSVMVTTRAGASASWKTSARSFALVASKGPGMGKVQVLVDGRLAATVDLLRSTAQPKSVVWAKSFAGVGTHTIKVVALGTAGRPRVEIDALATLK